MTTLVMDTFRCNQLLFVLFILFALIQRGEMDHVKIVSSQLKIQDKYLFILSIAASSQILPDTKPMSSMGSISSDFHLENIAFDLEYLVVAEL